MPIPGIRELISNMNNNNVVTSTDTPELQTPLTIAMNESLAKEIDKLEVEINELEIKIDAKVRLHDKLLALYRVAISVEVIIPNKEK